MAHAKQRRRRNPATQGAFYFGSPKTILTERDRAAALLDNIISSHGATPKVAAAARSLDEIIDAHARRPSTRKKGRKTMAKPRRRSSRRPRHGRDARGRFLPARKKKGAARRRAAPKRRAAAARRPPRLGRDSRGRFLKRGAGGRRLRPLTRAYVTRARHRKGVKKHMRARRTIKPGQRIAGLIRINPRTGAIVMSRAKVANPRRKRRNPRRHYRARNPGSALMSTAKAALVPMVAGTAAGAMSGYIDAKWLSTRPTVSVLTKVGLGILGAIALRRRSPTAAMGFAGGMLGATGYSYGVKFGGGHVALNGMQGLKGLADMAADDPDTANLIAGLADVVPDGMGDAGDYASALADDDDGGMGDVVED